MTDQRGFVTSYSYDDAHSQNLASRITAIHYPSGITVNYSYNIDGQVNSVSARYDDGGTSITKTLANNISYLPFGGVENLT